MFADRARGLSWASIEQRHGISERQGRRIVDAYFARHHAELESDPAAVVRELLAHFEQAIEDLALLCAETEHDAVKLGAITRRLDVVERRITVLRSLGLLPRDWDRWSAAQDAHVVFKRLVDVLARRPDVPDDVVDELLTELDRMPDPTLSLVSPPPT